MARPTTSECLCKHTPLAFEFAPLKPVTLMFSFRQPSATTSLPMKDRILSLHLQHYPLHAYCCVDLHCFPRVAARIPQDFEICVARAWLCLHRDGLQLPVGPASFVLPTRSPLHYLLPHWLAAYPLIEAPSTRTHRRAPSAAGARQWKTPVPHGPRRFFRTGSGFCSPCNGGKVAAAGRRPRPTTKVSWAR